MTERLKELIEKLNGIDCEIDMLQRSIGEVEEGKLDLQLYDLYLALCEKKSQEELQNESDGEIEEGETSGALSGSLSTEAPTDNGTKTVKKDQKKDQKKEQKKEVVKSSSPDTTKLSSSSRSQSPKTEQKPKPSPLVKKQEKIVVEPQTPEEEIAVAELSALQSRLETVLSNALRKDRDTKFFDHAVTPEEAPTYKNEILTPVDLTLLKKRQKRGRYNWPYCKTVRDACATFARDLFLMFANASVFNPSEGESAVLDVLSRIRTSTIKHMAEFNIWPLPTERDVKGMISKRKAAAITAASHSPAVPETRHEDDTPESSTEITVKQEVDDQPSKKKKRRK